MAVYRRSAQRALRAIVEGDVRDELYEAVNDLEADPFPPDAIELKGNPGVFRIRVGQYRVLYQVSEKQQKIVIERVSLRETAYKGYEPYVPHPTRRGGRRPAT